MPHPLTGPCPARPWDVLYGTAHARLATYLEQGHRQGWLNDVDYVRIGAALARVKDRRTMAEAVEALRTDGVMAFRHFSGHRDLPGRRYEHDLPGGRVRLGVTAVPPVPASGRADPSVRPFHLDIDALRGTLLGIGPPGPERTALAAPILEHLCLQALANEASLFVIDLDDPPATDAHDHFDISIDPAGTAGSWGFDPYGGAATPQQAAERLAQALTGPQESPTEFTEPAKTTLHQILAPYHAAHRSTFPPIRRLPALLRADERALRTLQVTLRRRHLLPDFEQLRTTRPPWRTTKAAHTTDLLTDRLELLSHPGFVDLAAPRTRRFSMTDINRPLRVRLALHNTDPQAARILARLATAQFAHVATAPNTDRSLLKCLVVNGAAPCLDPTTIRALQQTFTARTGLLLLTDSTGDVPHRLRAVLPGAADAVPAGHALIFSGGPDSPPALVDLRG